MATVRLTMAQALVRYLAAQRVQTENGTEPLFGGMWAIFGHGNVAGLGEALHAVKETFPTFRAHNEQGMALAAVAYAKAHFRRRMMAVTSSIGPGCTNLVTAAGTAHVNRLPVLLLPGDIFVSRAPDPVLQQVEDFQDGNVSAADCLRPVSRYFDRIVTPHQLLTALPRAIAVLTDPAQCGPVTLALPQDVQAMAADWPEEFFAERVVHFRQPPPEAFEINAVAEILKQAKRPIVVTGGGVLYSEGGTAALKSFVEKHGIPVGESHAGKGALAWDHPLLSGSIGVTGSTASNALAVEAAAGQWEIVQAGQAELIAPSRYSLTRLLRGQRGTEHAMGNPAPAGARVVVLNTSLASLPIAEADLGLPWNWRVGPAARAVSDASYAALGFTPTGRGLVPFAPVHVEQPWRTARSPGDLSIRWTRRSRALVADAWEQVEVPLAEDMESYDVQILDGTTVTRTLTSGTTSVLYTAAQQTADWGAPLGPGQTLALRIFQLSNRLGRGTPAAVTLQF